MPLLSQHAPCGLTRQGGRHDGTCVTMISRLMTFRVCAVSENADAMPNSIERVFVELESRLISWSYVTSKR